MGCGGVDLFALELERAIDDGFDPVAARELVYQGNDASYLESVIINVLPYVGYPRSLNALAAVRKASEG